VDNNSIIFIASQGNDPEAIFIGEDSPIWVLTRPGYKFLGWYYLADGEEVKLTQGDYAFNDFVDNQVEVYSKWKTLVAYQQPYDISVNVSQSGNTITITWKLDLLGQVQPNFNLYIDKVLISDYTSLVTQDGLVFTLV